MTSGRLDQSLCCRPENTVENRSRRHRMVVDPSILDQAADNEGPCSAAEIRMMHLAQTAFWRPDLAVVANLVDEAEERLCIKIVVFVLVELATLNHTDATLPVLFELFFAIIDPFFDVVETIASPIEKFRVNVRSDERLDQL